MNADSSTSDRIGVNGVQLAYTLCGQGAAVVFLHGWMCNRTFWRRQYQELASRNYRCLAIDFRGHGDSEAPPAGYSIQQLSGDVGATMASLGLERAVIVGHSMGGMVAQHFCLEQPEQTAALVLVATIASDPGDRLISKRIASDACPMGFPRAFDRHFDAWFAPGTPKSVRRWVKTQMRSTPEDLGRALVGAYSRFDLTRRLGEIQRPTLVIGTRSDDSAPPGQSRRLAELIPGAQLALIEDCGHFPMLEKPQQLSRKLLPFLKAQAGSARIDHVPRPLPSGARFPGRSPGSPEALYGAQTQRALDNFPLAGERSIGDYPALVEALLRIKWAAAEANRTEGFLDGEVAGAIVRGARELIGQQAFHHFPIHRLHGGGGTSANMNANEVLANRAEELLGGRRGQYRQVHPNDHVNLHQSTNDVYPTACRMAVIASWPWLAEALEQLGQVLRTKASQFQDEPRVARTCLQDAVAVTFGDLFGGYEAGLARAADRIAREVEELHAVNLGGTIVGRPQDAPEGYRREILPSLRVVSGDPAYRSAPNLFDAAQNPDGLVAVSSGLDLLARVLIKAAKDLRLLSSGPEAGLGEIRLPAVQPGSSIMPGKVNPVIPEFVIQCCFQVLGNHAASAGVLDHGELDLNVWESVLLFNVLDSMRLLANAAHTLAERCLEEVTVVRERNQRNAASIIPLLTDLMKARGYSEVGRVCREAGGDLQKMRQLLKKEGWI